MKRNLILGALFVGSMILSNNAFAQTDNSSVNQELASAETTENASTALMGNMMVSAFPNPSDNFAMIKYRRVAESRSASINFVNSSGQEVKQIRLRDFTGMVIVSTAELPEDDYTYSLVIDGKLIDTKKVKVKH